MNNECGYNFKMSSSDKSDRIELSIDPGTWDPMAMDEDRVSLDPIEFQSEEEPYKAHTDSFVSKTGLDSLRLFKEGQVNERQRLFP